MNRPYRKIPSRAAARLAGFTLVELMISVALVLVLILGVNEVFSLTSRTIGAGMAYSTIHRDNRDAQSVMVHDFLDSVPMAESPVFTIESEITQAFLNPEDQRTDLDGNVMTYNLGGVNKDDYTTPYYIYNRRNHRIDRIGFFARGYFASQTGNGASFVDLVAGPPGVGSIPNSSNEAWIVYGHLKLGDKAASPTYWNPGTLDSGSSATANPYNFYASQWILGRSVMLLTLAPPNPPVKQYILRSNTAGSYTPLSLNSASLDGNKIQQSRYDVAQTSVLDYYTILQKILSPLVVAGKPIVDYWTPLIGFRYQGNPYPLRPLSSAGAAATVPCFVTGCSQFIVEYAGDFLAQDPTSGKVTSGPPDGVVDWVQVGNQRRTRWYGMPRDVDDDGVIGINDVVPLRDVRAAAGITPAQAPFERTVPKKVSTVQTGDQYIVAWGYDNRNDPKPKMVRITMTLDDPNGRIKNGQTFEYVFNLY